MRVKAVLVSVFVLAIAACAPKNIEPFYVVTVTSPAGSVPIEYCTSQPTDGVGGGYASEFYGCGSGRLTPAEIKINKYVWLRSAWPDGLIHIRVAYAGYIAGTVPDMESDPDLDIKVEFVDERGRRQIVAVGEPRPKRGAYVKCTEATFQPPDQIPLEGWSRL